MGNITYAQVRENFEQRHGGGEFQIVEGQKHETGRQFTTRETIAAELATIGHMQRGQNTVEPIMQMEQAAAYANTREFLNPAQRRAIEEVLTIRPTPSSFPCHQSDSASARVLRRTVRLADRDRRHLPVCKVCHLASRRRFP
jgi:hypothetical protein